MHSNNSPLQAVDQAEAKESSCINGGYNCQILFPILSQVDIHSSQTLPVWQAVTIASMSGLVLVSQSMVHIAR